MDISLNFLIIESIFDQRWPTSDDRPAKICWIVEKPALSLAKGWADARPPMTDHRKIDYVFICLMAMNNYTTWNVKPETWNLI